MRLNIAAVSQTVLRCRRARFDDNDVFEDAALWTLGLIYEILDAGVRLHASAGSDVVNPSYFELYADSCAYSGNPALSPERNQSFDTGAEFAVLGGRGTVDVTYFNETLTDEITAVRTGAGTYSYSNQAGDSDRQGLEISVSVQATDILALRTDRGVGVCGIGSCARDPDWICRCLCVWFAAGRTCRRVNRCVCGDDAGGAARVVFDVDIAISALAGALTSLVLNLSPNPFAANEIVFWMMGSFADRSMTHVWIALPLISLGALTLMTLARGLDALTLGEDAAEAMGIGLRRMRLTLIFGNAAVVGAAVGGGGYCGACDIACA